MQIDLLVATHLLPAEHDTPINKRLLKAKRVALNSNFDINMYNNLFMPNFNYEVKKFRLDCGLRRSITGILNNHQWLVA